MAVDRSWDTSFSETISTSIERLARRDNELTEICLGGKGLSDADVHPLILALESNPNNIAKLYLWGNSLTDATGVALARFLVGNPPLLQLYLNLNQLTDETAVAIAQALRTNRHLQVLYLHIKTSDQRRSDDAFTKAIRYNKYIYPFSNWELYAPASNEFDRLKTVATQTAASSSIELNAA